MVVYLFLLATLALCWLLVIRPQQRRIRAHQALTSSLQPGDEIVTTGGLYGVVTRLDDEVVHVEVAPGLEVRVARQAVVDRVTDDDRAAHGAALGRPAEPAGNEAGE